ncbi:FUSC family protein [Streptomyces sp. DT24]|uniref:FUSC family protein n=1 Tax=unclassified Streptomyces TaxID=2593676 RepID=UPI003CEFC12D
MRNARTARGARSGNTGTARTSRTVATGTKKLFTAPDPGRLRLRSAGRAVLGVGLAVAVSGAADRSLIMAVTGGLVALLALFTVTDPTVRNQAITTALLPVVGFPVLALATALHDRPLSRDALFLAVIGAGVHARRWGPRGHALGVFAFMTFFLAQFLHAVPAQLPQLYAAVAVALLASSSVRFGLWCYERGLPTPRPPAPPGGRGIERPATRQAVQATVACAFALAVGQFLSHDRWYWAVGAAWWIFVNTASRGETLVRGFRRVLGTALGIVAGLAIAVPLHGNAVLTSCLVAVCVGGIFYAAAVSYSWMMFFVTVLAGVLYGLLGVLDPGLLVLRLVETVTGAVGAALAVLLVLPLTTHATTDAWIQRALRCVHLCTAEAAARLAGSPSADPTDRIAELDLLLERVRVSVAPLVHPLNPSRARKARARRVLALLDDCAGQVRGLASVAADPDASHDARLAAACRRVESALKALTTPALTTPTRTAPTLTAPDANSGSTAPGSVPPPLGAGPALTHLHGLEHALAELVTPLRSAPRAPLVPS